MTGAQSLWGSTLDTIKPREERVIRLLFGMECRDGTGQPMTRKQAAELLQVSVYRIEDIERDGMRKLDRDGVRAALPAIAPGVRRAFVRRWLTHHPRFDNDPEKQLDRELLESLI